MEHNEFYIGCTILKQWSLWGVNKCLKYWGWFLFRRDSGKRAKQPPVWNPDKQRVNWVRLFALKYITVQVILYIFIVIRYLDQRFKTLGWLNKENMCLRMRYCVAVLGRLVLSCLCLLNNINFMWFDFNISYTTFLLKYIVTANRASN